MSENLSDPSEKSKGGLIAGTVMLVLAALVAGGYYYYANYMKPAAASSEQMEASATQTEVASAAGDETQAAAKKEEKQPVAKPLEVPPFEGKDVKPGNPVVAKVNGQDVTRTDVFEFIQQMPPQVQQLPPQQVYPLALEQVVNNELLQEEADKGSYESSEAFKQEMAAAKKNIIRTLYLQDKMAEAITEDKIKALYDQKISQMSDVEQRHARHILVETEDEAKKIIEELKGGADFAELAKKHSKGPTGENGGDLGWFAKGQMVPEFSEVVFKTKPGTLVETPVKTQFGWHVIKVEDRRIQPKPTLEQMLQLLMAEVQREELGKLITGLRSDADIVVFGVNGEEPGAAKAQEPEAAAPSAGDEQAEPAPQE